jgi:hypothetical protein
MAHGGGGAAGSAWLKSRVRPGLSSCYPYSTLYSVLLVELSRPGPVRCEGRFGFTDRNAATLSADPLSKA